MDLEILKQFHRKVKSNLLAVYATLQGHHLDLGCGSAKDIKLWKENLVHRVHGIDVDPTNIEKAYQRTKDFDDLHMVCRYSVADLTDKQTHDRRYNCVSCMYTMQHLFKNERGLRHFMQFVSDSLKLHGHFVGVALNADAVQAWVDSKRSSDHFEITPLRGFHSTSPYGRKYSLRLGSKVVSEEEYLVDFGVLQSLAEEYGLYFVESKDVYIPIDYPGRPFTHLHRTFVFLQTKLQR